MKDKEKLLVPNTRVTLRAQGKSGVEVYQSRIEDVTAEFVVLAMPSKEGEIVPLQIGDTLEVTFTHNNGLYVFKGPILRRERSPLPVVYLTTPLQLERQQRRQYVRVETFLPVKFRRLTPEERLMIYDKCPHNPKLLAGIKAPSPLTKAPGKEPLFEQGIIHNISGGGMLVVSASKVNQHELLLLNFALQQEEKTLEAYAQVIRAYKYNEEDTSYPFSLGLQFILIDPAKRHKIIQYAFKRQIELREKGVL